jgi:hypothetical protein
MADDAESATAILASTNLHTSTTPKPSGNDTRPDLTRNATVSPESNFMAVQGFVTTQSPFISTSTTVPDLCNLHSLTWAQNLFKVLAPVSAINHVAFTCFDQAMLTMYIMLIICSHNEIYSPNSSQRDALICLYTPLMRMFGSLILLNSEVRMIESFLPHAIQSLLSHITTLQATLPDTPGVIITDASGYIMDSTAMYYILSPVMVFDHMFANCNNNTNNRILPLGNAPANYPTNWFMRSNGLTGISKMARSSILNLISSTYNSHGNLPNIADTWHFMFLEIGNIECKSWVNSLVTRRNQAFNDCKIPHSEYTLASILGKNYVPKTLKNNNDLAFVQCPTAAGPANAPAATAVPNSPNRTTMCQEYKSMASIVISDNELSLGSLLGYNSYYRNFATTGTFIGSVQATPVQDQVNRDSSPYERRPVPSWAGPIMIGPIFSDPLIASKAIYDRSLIGKFESSPL